MFAVKNLESSRLTSTFLHLLTMLQFPKDVIFFIHRLSTNDDIISRGKVFSLPSANSFFKDSI